MRFARSENAHDVLLTLRSYVERYGIPREIYTDKATIYYPKSKHEHLTDVGRALTRLGITMILVHSPQAKGRVESRQVGKHIKTVWSKPCARKRSVRSMLPIVSWI